MHGELDAAPHFVWVDDHGQLAELLLHLGRAARVVFWQFGCAYGSFGVLGHW